MSKGSARRPGEIKPGAWEAIFSKVAPERECKCSLREKLVGDGCDVCNPEYAKQFDEDDEP